MELPRAILRFRRCWVRHNRDNALRFLRVLQNWTDLTERASSVASRSVRCLTLPLRATRMKRMNLIETRTLAGSERIFAGISPDYRSPRQLYSGRIRPVIQYRMWSSALHAFLLLIVEREHENS